jgi:hypothetical protein
LTIETRRECTWEAFPVSAKRALSEKNRPRNEKEAKHRLETNIANE